MKVIITTDYASMSRLAADRVAEQVARRDGSVLGLATGSTPEGLYAELVARVHQGFLDLSRVTTFNLDEYLGVPREHEASYHCYMQRHLFHHVKVAAFHIPDGSARDPAAECQRYEAAIRAMGGIDLQILGIGRNGHIGFNEPGSPFGEGTRVVDLTPDTITANARFFDALETVPRKALSMGIRTIMSARSILLLANGSSKAEAVAAAVHGPVTEALPASVLQLHPDAILIVDAAAAALLKRSDLVSA